MGSWLLIWFMTDWNPAQSSVLMWYKVIETSLSSKLADKRRKQMGDCHVLVAGFWRRNRYYYSYRISVFVEFTAALHRNLGAWVFCSAPTLGSFSRTSPVPACCKEDLHASHPEACLGAGFMLSQKPLRRSSANPCLKRLFLRELEQVFQLRQDAICP